MPGPQNELSFLVGRKTLSSTVEAHHDSFLDIDILNVKFRWGEHELGLVFEGTAAVGRLIDDLFHDFNGIKAAERRPT